MLDWIFEGIATWVASVMTQIMDAISGVFIGALGTDMTAMEEYFPFAVSAYTIIQYTAWALLFLVAVWQIFRAFSGPLAETENPLAILARGAIFGFLIAYAKPIFSLALDIARAPYTALMDSTLDPGDFTFAGIEQALTNGLTTLVSVGYRYGTTNTHKKHPPSKGPARQGKSGRASGVRPGLHSAQRNSKRYH